MALLICLAYFLPEGPVDALADLAPCLARDDPNAPSMAIKLEGASAVVTGTGTLLIDVDGRLAHIEKVSVRADKQEPQEFDRFEIPPLSDVFQRQFRVPLTTAPKKNEPAVSLEEGNNSIEITVTRRDGVCLRRRVDLRARLGALHAVLIGVTKYPEEPIVKKLLPNRIKFATSDAEQMKAHLVQHVGAHPNNVHLLLDPDKEDVDYVLDELTALELTQFDTLVFFFSGHGYFSDARLYLPDKYYLVPAGLKTIRSQTLGLALAPGRLVSLPNLVERIKKLGAGRVVFFIDACYSGGGIAAKGDEGIGGLKTATGNSADISVTHVQDVWKPLSDLGIFGIVSSAATEPSWEHEDLKHGVFTYYLLQAFKEAKADPRGNITLKAIYEYVKDEVRKWTAAKSPKVQTPDVHHPHGSIDSLPFAIIK